MPAKHTPTPWHVQPIGGQCYVETQGPKLICDMQADACQDGAEVAEMEANAAFIVQACNCHDELVAALEAIMPLLDSDLDAVENWQEEAEAARAVLAKARSE